MTNFFRTKSNRVTAYALTVGMVERTKIRNIQLTIASPDAFHYVVTAMDTESGNTLFSEKFVYINSARDAFDRANES